jgi:diadenosine tetraphosphate (Ap4A) HIT family hydrolase
VCGSHADANGVGAPGTCVTRVACPLCAELDPESVLWEDAYCRVIDVGDPDYPGYCRVIWNAHVREMSDLADSSRTHLLTVVCGVERVLRDLLSPDKINLASLGNQVPHVHWHVIPRFADDPHFPDSIWAARRRTATPRPIDPAVLVRELSRKLPR